MRTGNTWPILIFLLVVLFSGFGTGDTIHAQGPDVTPVAGTLNVYRPEIVVARGLLDLSDPARGEAEGHYYVYFNEVKFDKSSGQVHYIELTANQYWALSNALDSRLPQQLYQAKISLEIDANTNPAPRLLSVSDGRQLWNYRSKSLQPVNYFKVSMGLEDVHGNISYDTYNPLYEALEYGQYVQYKYEPELHVWAKTPAGHQRVIDIVVTQPEYRALLSLDLKYEPKHVATIEWFNVSSEAFPVPHLVSIASEDGTVLWTKGQTLAPRPLNPLEQWAVTKARYEGDTTLLHTFLDEPTAYGKYDVWSPAEIEARYRAYGNHARIYQNNVWVFIPGSSEGPKSRFIDSEGTELQSVFDGGWAWLMERPEDGLVTYQRAYDKGEGPQVWSSLITFHTNAGSVVKMEQGSVRDFGSIESMQNPRFYAQATEYVSQEDLLANLPTFYAEALALEGTGNRETVVHYRTYAEDKVVLVRGDVPANLMELLKAYEGSYQVMYYHVYDPSNAEVAAWMDAHYQFDGWRELNLDFRHSLDNYDWTQQGPQ